MIKPIYFFTFIFTLVSYQTYCQEFQIDTLKLSEYLNKHHNNNRFDGIALIAYKDSIIYRNLLVTLITS